MSADTTDQVNELFTPTKQHGKRFYISRIKNNEEAYLTKKEAVIVSELISGKRAKQIAWDLQTSLHTVNTHLANIKAKLECQNIFQLGLLLGSCMQPQNR